MDVFEKSAMSAAQGDFVSVVQQFGRAIRRALIFDSMLTSGNDADDPDILYQEPLRKRGKIVVREE